MPALLGIFAKVSSYDNYRFDAFFYAIAYRFFHLFYWDADYGQVYRLFDIQDTRESLPSEYLFPLRIYKIELTRIVTVY